MILVIVVVIALVSGISLYNYFIAKAMRRYISKSQRDAIGVMKGAESVYLENQSEKAALLVHGFIGSPTDYGQLPRLLFEKGYTVSVPLLPRHGTSPKDFSNVTPEELEEFVLLEYQKLKARYKEVVLIGFSMGGALSILTATKIQVDKLVLLAPYLKIKHQWFYILPAQWHNKIFKRFIPYVYRPLIFKQINKKDAIPNLVDYDFVSLKGADIAIQIGQKAAKDALLLDQPILIVHGQKDGATDFQSSRILAEILNKKNKCRFVSLPNTNHMVLWDYDASIAEKEVLDFLTEPITKREGVYETVS
jgi:carboxylesterase